MKTKSYLQFLPIIIFFTSCYSYNEEDIIKYMFTGDDSILQVSTEFLGKVKEPIEPPVITPFDKFIINPKEQKDTVIINAEYLSSKTGTINKIRISPPKSLCGNQKDETAVWNIIYNYISNNFDSINDDTSIFSTTTDYLTIHINEKNKQITFSFDNIREIMELRKSLHLKALSDFELTEESGVLTVPENEVWKLDKFTIESGTIEGNNNQNCTCPEATRRKTYVKDYVYTYSHYMFPNIHIENECLHAKHGDKIGKKYDPVYGFYYEDPSIIECIELFRPIPIPEGISFCIPSIKYGGHIGAQQRWSGQKYRISDSENWKNYLEAVNFHFMNAFRIIPDFDDYLGNFWVYNNRINYMRDDFFDPDGEISDTRKPLVH